MSDRLEQALTLLNRAHVRAGLYRCGKTADLIDDARRLIEAEIVDAVLVGTTLDLEAMIDGVAGDDRAQGFA